VDDRVTAARTSWSDVSSFVARLVATAGGAGYVPVAPGTAGTLVAVPLAWALRDASFVVFLGVTVLVTIGGIVAASRADQVWESHDCQKIVIDEVAGYLVTVALVDRSSGWVLGVGFAVFRILDTLKPPPVRWIDERVPGGAGVVLDDVAAGVLGAALMVALASVHVFERLAKL